MHAPCVFPPLFDKYSHDSIAARILDVVARAEWKSLWETALRLAKRETDKSIKARVDGGKK